LEEGSQNAHVLVLDSPVLSCADWSRLKSAFGKAVAEIDCTYPVDSGADGLRAAIAHPREAEEACAPGCSDCHPDRREYPPGSRRSR
jgi:glutamate synthase (NADPH/NADH) large chain